MKRRANAALAALTLALAACGGGSSGGGDTPAPAVPADPPPVVTAVGTPIGNPVSQAMGAAGGTVSVDGVTVSAPAGAFTAATLTVQAVSDTLKGSGRGISVTSDAAWARYLTISFPIEAADDSPEGLGLALQQADGSWLSLEPVRVDTVAGTVSAGLSAAQVAPLSAGRARALAQGPLKLNSVIKYRRFYMQPASATVKVNESVSFVPRAEVLQSEKCGPQGPATPPGDLEPLIKLCPVVRAYDFTNHKDGFSRYWYVNTSPFDAATLGSVTETGSVGARYTAPAQVPNPDHVTVVFDTFNIKSGAQLLLKAWVTITGDQLPTWVVTELAPVTYLLQPNGKPRLGGYAYTGTMNELHFSCHGNVAQGHVCVPSGSFTITTESGGSDGSCTTRIEPPTLVVNLSTDAPGYLKMPDPADPRLQNAPGDYEAVVFHSWTATRVVEPSGSDPCQSAGRYPDTPFSMYFLLTGTAGKGQVVPNARVLNGSCRPAGNAANGGECNGNDLTYTWSMTRQ